MIDKITIELLDKWKACKRKKGEAYSNENLRILFDGKEFVTPLEVLDLKIPLKDKLWVLLRQEVLGDQFMVPVNNAVSRARKCADSINFDADNHAVDNHAVDAADDHAADAADAAIQAESYARIAAYDDAEVEADYASACASYSIAFASISGAFSSSSYASASTSDDACSSVAAYIVISDARNNSFNNAVIAELERQLDDIKAILKEGK
jgi:hypothetical protein